ncbi:PDZ/DHR/GLGF domain protein [Dictyocaulus viviparus]|uniref:PDZ/DHR/GLGF domain protein n=1 Tax=Dictyocaulus viviparus TaxID=29172 RepID=A0A0D8YAC9_DICVI|nr:PDZ/DHR/GLGF domain protein [Dictyocaulus viviparus]
MARAVGEHMRSENEDAPPAEFNPIAAFGKERGFPEFIPKNLIETHTFAIECAAGEPEAKQFKITNGIILIAVPAFMHPPFEYGDYITKINGEIVHNRIHFYQVIRFLSKKFKQQMIRFTVERVITSVQVSRSDVTVPSEMLSVQHCDYFKNTMIFFPRSSLGINIKSVNKKVYVESTDNGFNSIARRAFYIGDALLSVNDTPCTSVREASKYLINALKTTGIVRVLVERPVEPAAVAFVKAVLLVNKANVMDPKMPDDVMSVCKAELHRMNHENCVPLKNLLKESTKSSSEENERCKKTQTLSEKQTRGRSVTISSKSSEVGIGMEMINPALLERVPEKIMDSALREKTKKNNIND